MKTLAATFLACAVTTSVSGQWLTFPTPGIPRSADGKPNLSAPTPLAHDGHPDLSGLWNTSGARGDVYESDKAQPWLQALIRQREEDFGKDNPAYSCLPLGPGYHTNGGMRRILQTPTLIAVLSDDLRYRQIFMDGRALEPDPNPTWMGYSVGRWDGNTLIVESTGFNDRTWLTGRGVSHTEALRMTERYRRPDFGHLEVDVTFTDPAAYTAPLHLSVGMTLAADTELLEAVCDNLHGQQHWVGTASDAKKTAVTLSADILSKYIGVYKGLWGRTPRTVRITLVDGALVAQIDDRPWRVQLLAQSETAFVGDGLGYEFVRDEHGIATHLIERHVSGAYSYPRQPQ